MKKKIWITALATFFVLSVSMLFMVACKKAVKEAPQAPTGANSYISGTTIKVSWNSVKEADYYLVMDGDGYSMGNAYGTSYTDYSPDEGYNYYHIYAVNQYGTSSGYASTSCYYHDENGGGGGGGGTGYAPSTPTGVSATVDGSRIKVSWNSVSNANEYTVYWSNTGSSYNYVVGTTSSTYIFDNDPYEDNYYKVKAKNSYGESEMSSYAYCHYSSGGGGGGGGSAPSKPTGVTATVVGSRIKVSWNSVSNADSYTVYWTSSGSGYSSIGTTTNTYFYDDYPSTDNYYKIKANNSYGSSSYSSSAYCHYSSGGGGGTVHSPCPVHYTSHTATSSTITLRWTNPTSSGCGTPTKAYLRVKKPDSNEYVDLQTLSGSASSASFNYLLWITYNQVYSQTERWVYCGIITENSAGTSGGIALAYNVDTDTWYGGNGLELSLEMEQEAAKIEQ